MGKPKLLQAVAYLPELEEQLAREFNVTQLWKEADAATFLARHSREFPILLTSGGVGADANLIEALPGLKAIVSRGVGYDKIDVEAARRHGIAISNTPNVLNDCVADLAFGALLAVARGIPAAERFVRRGDWQRGRFPLTTRVSGKKLGIVGLGRIGATVAKRAYGFDMDVRYHNTRPLTDVPYEYEASLAELARWADFLVLTVSGGARTKHLVSREVIEALGPEGYLVNVARGSVVDEPALVEALAAKKIAGAALDVFEHEPKVPEALLALDNVVLLPHLASSTHETWRAMEELAIANLRQFAKDKTLVTPIPA